jgi:hypothetical protein
MTLSLLEGAQRALWWPTGPILFSQSSILKVTLLILHGGLYFVDRSHGFALHGDRGAPSREALTNFANESAWLAADNVRN